MHRFKELHLHFHSFEEHDELHLYMSRLQFYLQRFGQQHQVSERIHLNETQNYQEVKDHLFGLLDILKQICRYKREYYYHNNQFPLYSYLNS